jgi:hypothetical protein
VSQSGFESLAAHHAGVTGILVYLASSDLAACAFESHLPHSNPGSFNGRIPGPEPGDVGSSPAPGAMPLQLIRKSVPFARRKQAARGRPEDPYPASPLAGGTSLRRMVVPVRVRRWVPRRVSSPGESAEPVPPRHRVRDLHAALMGNGVTGIPQAFEALRCASESRFPSSCLCSSSG